VGLNFGVRDINHGIRSHPDYTQARYIGSILQGVGAARAAFPLHTGFLAFFGFNDGQAGVPVDQQLITLLDAQYNSPGQPSLAFFIENLSDLGPVPLPNGGGTGNNLLAWAYLGGPTMAQALDSWLAHRPDRDPQLLSLNPATGIALAFNAYGTRFFELYVPDLDGAASGARDAAGRLIGDDLRHWNALLNPVLCVPDFNADGIVDFFDYDDFVSCFEGVGCPSGRDADLNADGSTDFFDYDDFVVAFESPC
jgi:hypothetical protein